MDFRSSGISFEVESEVKAKVEAEVKSKVEAEVEAKVEAEVEAEVKIRVEAKVEAKVEAEVESKAESRIPGGPGAGGPAPKILRGKNLAGRRPARFFPSPPLSNRCDGRTGIYGRTGLV